MEEIHKYGLSNQPPGADSLLDFLARLIRTPVWRPPSRPAEFFVVLSPGLLRVELVIFFRVFRGGRVFSEILGLRVVLRTIHLDCKLLEILLFFWI